MNSQATCPAELWPGVSDFHQHQGEKHRERIVGAGFRFQGGADTRPQPQPLRMHQQEHRRRVG